MKKKVRPIRVLGLVLGGVPLIIEAVATIADDIGDARDPESDGGAKVTGDEVVTLVDRVHEALRPLARHFVDGLVQ